jgi:hypothetical protein
MLQQVEREDMRCYTEADRRRDIQALLNVPNFSQPTNISGLVVQQRLFGQHLL